MENLEKIQFNLAPIIQKEDREGESKPGPWKEKPSIEINVVSISLSFLKGNKSKCCSILQGPHPDLSVVWYV